MSRAWSLNPFDLDVLLWPASAIFVFTLLAALRVARNLPGAMLAALLKAGIFLTYFGWAFDGTFTFLDDWNYLEGGYRLRDAEAGVTNLTENWELLTVVGKGAHVVYYLYNAYALRIFGEGYYAPVACNILLTALIAGFGARLAVREFGLTRRQERCFFYFLLFHPDILAWSSITNCKDILVLLLHVLLLFSVSLFYGTRLRGALLLGLPAGCVLLFLRYYAPVLFAAALVGGAILNTQTRIASRVLHLSLGGVAAGVLLINLGGSGIESTIFRIQEHLVNPVYGFPRFILTPIPFNTEAAYAFLSIPALLHWMLMPFVALGFARAFRIRTAFSRFFLLYLLAFCGLYAVYGELQGPRHRVQLDYAWAIFQFLGLALVFGKEKLPRGKTGAASRLNHLAQESAEA